MTKLDEPLKPVTHWENAASKGQALCAEYIFREHIEQTQALRDRQAAYLKSMPTDPTEVIRAAIKLMHPKGDDYPDGIEEALHLSYALEALVKEGDLEAQGRSRDAALYVARTLSFAMHRATLELDRISDILKNPDRIERERREEETTPPADSPPSVG